MSNSQPNDAAAPQPPPPSKPPSSGNIWSRIKPNTDNPLTILALVVTPTALVGLILPPRRIGWQTILLGCTATWGTDHLAYEYTGKSFNQRFDDRFKQLTGSELNEKAQETKERLAADKERRAKIRFLREELSKAGKGETVESLSPESRALFLEAFERQKKEDEEKKRKEKEDTLLNRVWMGDADPDWKAKRDAREKEALQEGGGGYLKLITDQISEVWSGGKKNSEGDTGDAKGKTDAPKKE